MEKPPYCVAEQLNGSMRLWGFTASHDRLVVEVYLPDRSRKFINFVLCKRVTAPIYWQSTSPTVTRDGETLWYRDAGVEIACEEIVVSGVDSR